jgi:hypothetical protein
MKQASFGISSMFERPKSLDRSLLQALGPAGRQSSSEHVQVQGIDDGFLELILAVAPIRQMTRTSCPGYPT